MRVLHRFQIVDIGSSVVPVHDDEIHVLASQQLLDDVLQPARRRPGGPVPVDEEGGGPGGVELGLGRQVGVGHEVAAGDILPGVEQQPHIDVGSNECVAEIQVRELIAFLSWRWREDETGQNADPCRYCFKQRLHNPFYLPHSVVIIGSQRQLTCPPRVNEKKCML